MLFKIQSHTRADKEIFIDGPIGLTIDYDDVDHDQVDYNLDILINLLNDEWPKWIKNYPRFERVTEID